MFFIGCSDKNKGLDGNDFENYKYRSYQELKDNLLIKDHKDSIQGVLLELPEDTLKNNLLFDISYHYLLQNDSANFKFWNSKTRQLSISLNDSTKLAESYWDLASFWYAQNITDSAYYNYSRAFTIYDLVGDNFQASRMMLSMAKMQTNIKDYLGSEISTIHALKTFIRLKKYQQVYSSYNNLAILHNGLGEYEKSLQYHKKALIAEQYLNNEKLRASTFNNIGVVYQNIFQYELSIKYYNKALKFDSIYLKDPRLYAMLLDNSAYARLKLKDTLGLEEDFLEALKIRDSIDHKAGIVINRIHLGEFYLYKQDTLKALNQIQEAKSLSEEYKSYEDLLEALIMLSKIDSDNSNLYYSSYISLSDSLQNEERQIRNKFARIRFETDEFIAENEVLNKKNFWIITGSTSILILLVLLYIIKHERNKNQKLSHIQKQQLANEEIYNLLIASQNKLDEGREREKKRISKELHDGILSKFFGIRLNLELLNNSINKESITEREKYIHELKKLENEIRIVSHQLSDNIFSSENSFKTIIKELLNSQKDLGSFQFKLNADEKVFWEEISSKIKINIYRIIQEALHNIIKYSKASRVEINFSKDKNDLKVEVKDDGIGFNINKMSEGIGHRNMRSRISDLEGEIQIKSSNSGTEIIMYIPI